MRENILLLELLTSFPCWSSFSVSSSWFHSLAQPYCQGRSWFLVAYPGLRHLTCEFLPGSLISAFAAFSLCFPTNHWQGASCSFQSSEIPEVLHPNQHLLGAPGSSPPSERCRSQALHPPPAAYTQRTQLIILLKLKGYVDFFFFCYDPESGSTCLVIEKFCSTFKNFELSRMK